MSDDLAGRRILKREPLPNPHAQGELTMRERIEGWRATSTINLPRHHRARLWEMQHHCGLSVDDDGSLLYLSFAAKRMVRFPTMQGEMVER